MWILRPCDVVGPPPMCMVVVKPCDVGTGTPAARSATRSHDERKRLAGA